MKFKITLLVVFLLVGSFLFYWYQVRPAQIKHDCSWVKMYTKEIKYRPALTKDELIQKRIIRSCENEIAKLKKIMPDTNYQLGTGKVRTTFTIRKPGEAIQGLFDDPLFEATSCIEDGDKVIAAYAKPIQAVPSKEVYVPATKDQYNFCLHDRGL